jgi:hypothetical protein
MPVLLLSEMLYDSEVPGAADQEATTFSADAADGGSGLLLNVAEQF